MTPSSRDRYVDLLRVLSILVVVLGHWFIALIYWKHGKIGVHNAVGVARGLWLGTWILQVMPLFFFVGGFSNFTSLESSGRRSDPLGRWYRARLLRLMKPTAVFAGVWLAIQFVLHLTSLGGAGLIRGGMLPFGPLWFLMVYIAVIGATPIMARLHRRFGTRVILGLVAAAALVDIASFWGEVRGIRWLNIAFVWLNAHQLGFLYADGTLVRATPRTKLSVAILGLTGLTLLTNIGVYPRSMLGTHVERVSNMNPPTLCIVALTFWLVGLAMLFRDHANRWLANRRRWKLVVLMSSMIMTLFLWHLTALLLAILILYPLGLGHPDDTTASWWLQRPLWLAVPGLILSLLVLIFGRFERPATRPSVAQA